MIGWQADGDVEKPVVAGMAEQVVDREPSLLAPVVGSHHEDEVGPEGRADPPRHGRHVVGGDRATEFPVAAELDSRGPALELPCERSRQRGEGRHGPTISVMRVRRVATGAGTASPRRTRAPIQSASGASRQGALSPTRTPAGAGPYSIRLVWATSATPATANRASTTPMSHRRPLTKPACSSANSDTKRPNGGRPTRASPPARNSQPVPGITWSRPDTRAMSAVR